QVCLLPPRHPALCTPLTANRLLGDCHIANVPMKDLVTTDLVRAGFQLVESAEACERTIRMPIDNWIEIGALLLLGRASTPACPYGNEGHAPARQGHASPQECPGRLVTASNCFTMRYPWDLLRMNEAGLAMMDESSNHGEISPLASISGVV